MSEKFERIDISQNSWGFPACGSGLSNGQERWLQDSSCPFKSRPTGLPYDHPCDVCDLGTTESVSADCEAAIVAHCTTYRQYENDSEACLDFIEFLIPGRCSYDKLPPQLLDGLTKGITEGRDGKGIIFVFASGNDYASGDDVNFSALTNSRLTITVGSVGKDGKHASYSSPGAALFVSAPGSDYDSVSSHLTAANGGGCSSSEAGTSFSCPVVAGVIALILESNPMLRWRDVQGIIAVTSQQVEDENDETAVVNGAGIWHSNLFGFGIINADRAVTLAAENWTLYGKEVLLAGESGILNETILDDANSGITSNISIPSVNDDGKNTIVESVEVFIHLEHFSRGDLEIILESPSGTFSVLHEGRRIENTQQNSGERWKLLTVRNWGESAAGDWVLSIRDISPGNVDQCVDAPFYNVFKDKTVTCTSVQDELYCIDGERTAEGTQFDNIFELDDNGWTIDDACCVCGGGINATDTDGMLIQWRLVIFGHQDDDTATIGGNSSSSSRPDSPSSPGPTMSPQAFNGTNTEMAPSTKPTTTELVIIIAGTVFVFLFVTAAVWWSCKPPRSMSRVKFQPIDKTSEIA